MGARTPGMSLLSPVGFVSYYFEFHPQYTLYYAPHVAAMVLGGVLARYLDQPADDKGGGNITHK